MSTPLRPASIFVAAIVWAGCSVVQPAAAAPAGYPTEVLADYVFGCMASNGQSPPVLQKCSCSIDLIAERLTYEEYERAETVLRMQQVNGDPRAIQFKQASWAVAMVDRLREAQAEADTRCFR